MLVIPIFIPQRGCPHQCLFCNQEKITGVMGRPPTEGRVDAVIKEWLRRSPGHDEVQVAFFGGSFTCLPVLEQRELLAAVQPYIEAKRVDCIRLSTRPDCIDTQIISLLQEYRVKIVELGAQSMTDKVLQLSRRGHDSERIIRAFTILRENNIEVGLQLMPGLPGENRSSFLAGIKKIVAMAPDFVRLYPVLVLENSALAQMYAQKKYRPLSLTRALALTARSYQILAAAGIPVVRMGLQPTDTLEKNIVAGPYHPAFGELVLSRIWFKRIRARMARLQPGEKLLIRISNRDQSAVRGMGKKNIKRWDELGFAGRFTIASDTTMARGTIEYAVD